MAKASKKQSRKELLKEEDAFLEAANQGGEWVKDNRSTVIGAAVALFLIVGGLAGFRAYTDQRDEGASARLKDALEIAEAPVLAEGESSTEEGKTFPTETAKWEALEKTCGDIAESSAGSGVANLARFYQADALGRLDRAQEAEAVLSDLLQSLSARDNLTFLAVERLAYLQEARGDLQGAIETLGKLLQGEGSFYRDYALYHRGRLYQANGDEARAKELFAELKEKFPESELLEEVGHRIAALGGLAPQAAAAPAGNKDDEEAGDKK